MTMQTLNGKITGSVKPSENVHQRGPGEKMVDTSDEWITKRVGIKSGRIARRWNTPRSSDARGG
jgi:3-oxoacyl-[acyl-carrier-protein] synthase III